MNVLLVQDWAPADMTWNVPSWSISAEFAAYLLFPLVVLMARKIGRRIPVSLVAIVLLLALLNIFYASVDFNLGRGIWPLGALRCIAQFAIGAVLAQLYLTGSLLHRFVRPVFFGLSVLLLAFGLWRWESALIPVAWAALVFATARGDLKSGFLNQRWLVFAGEISYATYMIHYFVRDIFKLVLVHAGETTPLGYTVLALLTVLTASVPLYFLIERPAQKYLTANFRLQSIRPQVTGQVA